MESKHRSAKKPRHSKNKNKAEEKRLKKYATSISGMLRLIDQRLLPPENKNSENTVVELRFVDRLENELKKINNEIKQEHEKKAHAEKTVNRLKSKFNTTRGWVEDILTLLTDGFRIKNLDLITDSTYFASFSSLWSIGHTYNNPSIGQRKTRLSVDSLKLSIMVITATLKSLIAANPTVHMLLTAITVLSFLLEVVKKYYIAKQLAKKSELESSELNDKNSEIKKLPINDNQRDAVVIEKYKEQYNFYHKNNIEEFQIAIFEQNRGLVFAVVGFVGAFLMPGGVLVWGVACTGSGLIAGATFFEFIDRRLTNYWFTDKIATIPKHAYLGAKEIANTVVSTGAYVHNVIRRRRRDTRSQDSSNISSDGSQSSVFSENVTTVPGTLYSSRGTAPEASSIDAASLVGQAPLAQSSSPKNS